MEKPFDEALQNFTKDFAYVQAVRHLYDNGLSVSEIQKECMYPVSVEKVQKVINDYEAEKASDKAQAKYIIDTDKYGKHSFRRVSNTQKE